MMRLRLAKKLRKRALRRWIADPEFDWEHPGLTAERARRMARRLNRYWHLGAIAAGSGGEE